jgi:histidinol phosphatase-like enzyme
LRKKFGTIIVVSNQRGIGKGLMTDEDLLDIHQNMQHEIEDAGEELMAFTIVRPLTQRLFIENPIPGWPSALKKIFPKLISANR